MPTADNEDEWLEGGDAGPEKSSEESSEGPPSVKGVLVSKLQLHKLTAIAPVTLDKYFREGAPFVSKGSNRGAGWQIDTARFIVWLRKRDVSIATGDEDGLKYDAAKSRDKDAQARLREYQLAREMNLTITRPQAVAIYQAHVGEFRKRLLEVESQVTEMTPDRRAMLNAAIDLALAEFSGSPDVGDDYDFG